MVCKLRRKRSLTMGVRGLTDALHKLEGLTLGQLVDITRALSNERQRPNDMRVYVDASQLGFKFAKTSGGAVTASKSFLSLFVEEGMMVVVVFDPLGRHHSKRAAAVQRRSDCEKARISALHSWHEVMRVNKKLNSTPRPRHKEEEALKQKMDALQKQVNKFEKSASQSLMPDFEIMLRAALDDLPSGDRGGGIRCKTADYQADSRIAYEAIHKNADIILANDGDYPVLVGENCLMMSSFKYIPSNACIKKIELQSGYLGIIEKAREAAKIATSTFKKAKNPILDSLSDPRMRCLIAVGLGCDTYPGGIQGLGLATVAQKLPLHSTYPSLLTYFDSFDTSPGKDTLHTFVDALMYEVVMTEPRCYLFHRPATVPKYLEAFAVAPGLVHPGPNVVTCPGNNAIHPHDYLETEGCRCCTVCKGAYCRFCVVNADANANAQLPSKDWVPTWKCLSCHLGSEETADTCAALLTEAQLRKALESKGAQYCTHASLTELQEMYESIVVGDCLTTAPAPEFPLLASKSLDDRTLPVIASFDFSEGVRFIRDERLDKTCRCWTYD